MNSTHAFFFNPLLNICENDHIEYNVLNIGNDVWIGHNTIILPSCIRLGTGAVIAADAVVNKDVPDYGIFVGNPGRVVRFRFSKEKIEELLLSKWWCKDIKELAKDIKCFTNPIEGDKVR